MRTALWSALYWFGALCLIGLVSIIHGDCGTAGDDVHQCAVEAQRIDWTLLAVALALYGYLLWRRLRSRPSQ